jgi:peroxiredoxin Q/BCP
MIEVSQSAPAFCLPNQDGVEVCLRDLKGRWVVLYFYPKDSTPGCTTEACDFSDALGDFDNLEATVLGVSPDSVASHQRFVNKKDLAITLLSDEEKRVLEQYGIWQLKKLYGREYMGVVRTTYLIDPEGRVAHRWDKVRVKGHVQAVKEQLSKLQKS